ncbi:MAG: hypothetical protein KTR31_17945 [Myxococcales bacterium]|nr:hypothetical protein [Myxococcales bacterium]
MDEFASPSAAETGARQYGQLDIGVAVSEGVGAVLANLPAILGVGIVGIFLLYASFCTCVGWIVVLPLLMWGFYAFMLEALEGKGRFGTLFSGFNDFGPAFLRMWGFLLLMVLLYIPAAIAVMALIIPDVMTQIETGQPPAALSQTLKTAIPSLLWGFVIVRFMLAPFLIVERDQGPFQALQSAWEATSGQWLKLVALQLLLTLLTLPGQVLTVGGQMYGEQFQNDPAATLDAFPITMGLILGGSLVTSIAGIFGMMFYVSTYRQLTGPAPTAQAA